MRLVLVVPVVLVSLAAFPPHLTAQVVHVGEGSYTTLKPSGRSGPANTSGAEISPLVTENFDGPIPTSDWWSSLLWNRAGDPYSAQLYAHPLALKAEASGLSIRYPEDAVAQSTFYYHELTPDLIVGLADLAAEETRVDAAGDFSVTARWVSGSDTLWATMGHGLPFVYFEKSGADAYVNIRGTPTIWFFSDEVVGLTVNGHHYGIYAPPGAGWSGNRQLRSDLGGGRHFAVAVLPVRNAATLEFFRQRAYAHVVDTRVDWEYRPAEGDVVTTFSTEIEMVASGSDLLGEPPLALYRHQWLHTESELTTESYASPRGEMKLLSGTSFQTRLANPGILPALPQTCGAPVDTRLADLVQQVTTSRDFFPTSTGGQDTYWDGKAMGRMAELATLADKAALTGERALILAVLKQRLEAWLSAAAGNPRFWYSEEWTSLVGFPDGFGSSTELNDHHFHYGYFVKAAAVVARYDPDWALESRWGGMVELLIKDAANWDRGDARFPFLRTFDPYAGHSWASGHAAFDDGNNQESSSEAMNFAAGVALWGMETGNTELRDLGLYLFVTEMSAIDQYWFDVDDSVFPGNYSQTTAAQVWGNKGAYGTFFGNDAEFIHGINFLPFTAASLYLGRDSDYVQANYTNMRQRNGRDPDTWPDLMWQYLALTDPDAALAFLDANPTYPVEAGESRAHTYDWISSLQQLGRVDAAVTADVPSYAVFTGAGERIYAAYNPGEAGLNVTYSDGAGMTVAAGAMAVMCGNPTSTESLPESTFRLSEGYPNPTAGRVAFTIETSGPVPVAVEVFDALGRLVTSPVDEIISGRHTFEVPTARLPAGPYWIRATTESGTQTRSFLHVR